MKCSQCRFVYAIGLSADSHVTPKGVTYTCRRYPPQTVVLQTGDWVTSSEFPTVYADEFCGEYLPKNVSPSNSSTDESD